MNCPSCATPNPNDHRFCSACGHALPKVCGACGFDNSAEARFCGGCGKALQAGASDTDTQPVLNGEAERRQLTVMFCDLVGSTALSEGLDPEDLRDVLRRYQDAAAVHIESQSGFIARYMGDGLLVYFGYPQAHENDAERAIRAGLKIAREVGDMKLDDGRALAVRIGIATGQVVVGDIVGHGAAEERAVLGDTPNLAARLQGIAVPGLVVVSSTTRELAGGLFQYNELEPQQLKGIAEKVSAFSVRSESDVYSQSEVAAAGAILPMVGRDTELETLFLQWKAVTTGGSKTVWVQSDAGMGKSRLIRAVEERLHGVDHHYLVCYCSGAYSNSTYFPLKGGLRSLLGIAGDQSSTVTAGQLKGYLDEDLHRSAVVQMLHDNVPEDLPRLPDDAATARHLLVEAFCALLAGLSERCPVMFVLEDAHWADPSTRDLMTALLQGGVSGTMFLVATRPEGMLTAPAGAMTITLAELAPEAARRVVQQALDMDAVESGLMDKIVARAGGSPLFLEELGKAMRLSADKITIPATLQDALMARLDSLGPDKVLAQAASVIGRSFNIRALAAITGQSVAELTPALDRLANADFLEIATDEGHPYMFRHVLMQETAYQSILKSIRSRLHGLLATAMTGVIADLVSNHPEIAAFHFAESGEYSMAAQYWEQGGTRAAGRSAHIEAIEFFTNAVDTLVALPQTDETERKEMQLRTNMVASMRIVDRMDEALIQLDRAQEIALARGNLQERANLHSLRGNILFPLGDSDGSFAENEKVLELAREANDPEMQAVALSGLSDSCYLIGDIKAGFEYSDQCINLARSAGLDSVVGANLGFRGHLRFYLNQVREAIDDCSDAVELSASLGLKRAEMIARASCFAKVLYDAGRFEESVVQLQRGIELTHELGAGRFQPMYHSHTALICAQMGDTKGYEEHQDIALSALNPSRYAFVGGFAFGALAKASAALGEMDDSMEFLKQGDALMQDTVVFHNVLWFGRLAIDAAIMMENWDDVDRRSVDLAAAGNNNPIPWAVYFADRGHALAAVGRSPDSAGAIEKVRAVAAHAREQGLVTALQEMGAIA